MKKKVLALVMTIAAMTMMFSSCNKAEKLILGKWVNNENSYLEITSNGQSLEKEAFKAGEVTMTFNEDGTIAESAGATYVLDGDVLRITDKDETMEFNIITLEKKVLVMEYTRSETYTGTTYNEVLHYEFDKE